MRKRERWVGMPWVCWVQGDEREGKCGPLWGYPVDVEHCVSTLLCEGQRWVEFERVAEQYRVRVMPLQFGTGTGRVDYGFSYFGTDLGRVLAQAVKDHNHMVAKTRAFSIAKMEAPRWVP
jgi:hypothetical protein